jgi:hypothetical protein
MPGKGNRNNNNGGKGGRGGGKGKGRNNNGGRKASRGLRGVTQSVAISVNNAFGDNAKPQTVVQGLDAFDSSHVPLPRAVGDYTVIRSTEIFSASEQFHLLGPMKLNSIGGDSWTNICAQSSVNANGAIGAGSNTKRTTFSSLNSGAWAEARLTPAAFTVKLMNPEALQTTNGIVYIGRARQMLNAGGSSRTYGQLANELVSYSSPELCAAGRLALRGVKVDAVPYDMNALADFRTLTQLSAVGGDSIVTWSNDSVMYDGFAPIFVYNPNNVALQFMVCCEWRVRFDPSNPAYASHTYHRPSTPGYWDRVQRIGSALGNGVMDLAEKSAPQLMMNMAEKAVKRQLMLA